MGSKGSSTPDVVPIDTSSSDDQLQQMMTMMMEGMTSSISAMMGSMSEMEVPSTPPVETTPDVDWQEKLDELSAKTKADYSLETSDKKGRSDTVHTSPLLDDPEVTNASLTGLNA